MFIRTVIAFDLPLSGSQLELKLSDNRWFKDMEYSQTLHTDTLMQTHHEKFGSKVKFKSTKFHISGDAGTRKNSFISEEKKPRESRVTTYLFGDFLVENHLEFR